MHSGCVELQSLSATETPTRDPEDEWENPSELKTLTVDRKRCRHNVHVGMLLAHVLLTCVAQGAVGGECLRRGYVSYAVRPSVE